MRAALLLVVLGLPAPSAWATGARPATEAAGPAALRSPADLRALYGWQGPAWEAIRDGEPLSGDETELLLKILYRSAKFPWAEVERWTRSADRLPRQPPQVAADRGEFFRVRGRLVALERREVPAALVERFEMRAYYRCALELPPSDDPRPRPAVTIDARQVPRAWLERDWRGAEAGAVGLLLKAESSDPLTLALVAARMEWYPATPLGKLGMDVGLLDDVRDQAGLSYEEREAFYGMLRAVGRVEPDALLAQAASAVGAQGRATTSVVPLFNAAASHRGELVLLEGAVRRAVKIVIREPDVLARFGFDAYYELDLFTEDSQENPLVVCVPSLPEGMPAGDGPHYRETVRVAGFLLKTWAYPIAGASAGGAGPPRKRLAPLLIAARPQWRPSPAPPRPWLTPWVLGGALAGGGLMLGLAARHYNQRRRAGRRRALPDRISLPDAAIDQRRADR